MNRYLVYIGISAGFIAILIEALISHSFVKTLDSLTETKTMIVSHIICLEDYISSLKDAETGQRGFLITGDETYLDPYHKAVEFLNSPDKKEEIKNLENDPDIGNDIKHIEVLASNKLKELESAIKLRKEQGFEAAKKQVSDDSGKIIMNDLNQFMNNALLNKQINLKKQGDLIYQYFRKLNLIILLSNLFFFSLVTVCLLLLNHDINRRKKVENELKKLNSLNDVILDSAKEALITLDSKGMITTFNRGSEKIFGYSQGSVVNSSLNSLINNPENQVTLNRLSKKYDTPFKTPFDYLTFSSSKKINNEVPWTAFKKNNDKVYLLFSISPLADNEEKINGYLVEGVDITERKNFEEQLKIAQLKAEAATIAKSQFMARMSHDLRTPLTSILGFTEILQLNKDNKLNEKELSFLERIKENGTHLLSLINTILDLEKIESGRITIQTIPVDLNELIHSITNQLQSQFIQKNIQLIIDIPQQLNSINTDKQKLSQILINLIGNALKFTERGSIKIRVTKNKQSNNPECLDVIDTGKGIADNELAKIFDPFYQIKSPSSDTKTGSGLGLAISRSLCDILDFTLLVKSEVGKGSTFSILFY